MRAFLVKPEARPEGAAVSRRQMLACAAAVPAVALPAAAGIANPDAELLAAFEQWKAAIKTAESLPADSGDEPRDPYWDKVWEAQDALFDAPPPQTKAGIAAILSHL